jgi:tripartite-type tricarboxylate transporter receptor subunit TctC
VDNKPGAGRMLGMDVVMKEAALRDQLARQGLIVGAGTPAEFKAFIEAEATKWGAIIRKVGITVD